MADTNLPEPSRPHRKYLQIQKKRSCFGGLFLVLIFFIILVFACVICDFLDPEFDSLGEKELRDEERKHRFELHEKREFTALYS